MAWQPAPWQTDILSGIDPFSSSGNVAPAILYPENVRTPTPSSDLEGLARPPAATTGLTPAQQAYADQLQYGELLQAQAPLGSEFSGLATGELAPEIGRAHV